MKKIKLINNITKFKLFALLFLNLKAGNSLAAPNPEEYRQAREEFFASKTEEERKRIEDGMKNSWNPLFRVGVNNNIHNRAWAKKEERQEQERQARIERMDTEKIVEKVVERKMEDYLNRNDFSKFNK